MTMKYPRMEYDEDTDIFTIDLSSDPGEGGVSEIAPGVLVTFDAHHRLVSIELVGEVAKEYPELVASMREQAPKQPLRRTGS